MENWRRCRRRIKWSFSRSFRGWSVARLRRRHRIYLLLARSLALSPLPSRFMNMAVPASFFQRDIATETAGFFGASAALDFDSVDSAFESAGLLAAAAASGSPGALVAVGGGVNGATLELAVLARPNCQLCCCLSTLYRVG